MDQATVKLLTFSEVLDGMKHGKCYARLGWNGKGLHVKMLSGEGGFVPGCEFKPFFTIINDNTKVANTWVPSVSDLLAEDWYHHE